MHGFIWNEENQDGGSHQIDFSSAKKASIDSLRHWCTYELLQYCYVVIQKWVDTSVGLLI